MDYTLAQYIVGFIIILILINSIELILIGFVYAIVTLCIIWVLTFAYAMIAIKLDIALSDTVTDIVVFILTLGGVL